MKTNITSQDVAAFLAAQLKPLADTTDEFVVLKAEVRRYTDGDFVTRFSAYIAGPGHTSDHPNAEEAMLEAFRKVEDKEAKVKRLRDTAERLIKEADKTERSMREGGGA